MRESGGEEEREDDAEQLELRLRVREKFWDAETEETVRVRPDAVDLSAHMDGGGGGSKHTVTHKNDTKPENNDTENSHDVLSILARGVCHPGERWSQFSLSGGPLMKPSRHDILCLDFFEDSFITPEHQARKKQLGMIDLSERERERERERGEEEEVLMTAYNK